MPPQATIQGPFFPLTSDLNTTIFSKQADPSRRPPFFFFEHTSVPLSVVSQLRLFFGDCCGLQGCFFRCLFFATPTSPAHFFLLKNFFFFPLRTSFSIFLPSQTGPLPPFLFRLLVLRCEPPFQPARFWPHIQSCFTCLRGPPSPFLPTGGFPPVLPFTLFTGKCPCDLLPLFLPPYHMKVFFFSLPFDSPPLTTPPPPWIGFPPLDAKSVRGRFSFPPLPVAQIFLLLQGSLNQLFSLKFPEKPFLVGVPPIKTLPYGEVPFFSFPEPPETRPPFLR